LELGSGTLGGIVTTVEGLIVKISESKYAPLSPSLYIKMMSPMVTQLRVTFV
jgi:hypothetical protein